MSRSRKKTPCCNVVKPDGSWKRYFNRKVRHSGGLDVPSGNYYRRMNESYRIHDCRDVGRTFLDYSTIRTPGMVPELHTRDFYERCYIRK